MKTAEEIMRGCEHDGSMIPVNEVKRLMKAYHAAQLEAGIKCKALRKKGTNDYYYFDRKEREWFELSFPMTWHHSGSIKTMELELKKKVPTDSELIDITIIIDKP